MSVLVGYDGTEGADIALDEAARVASGLGTGLVVVFAFKVSRLGGEVTDYSRALHEHAQEVLERGGERARAAGVECETEWLEVETDPAQALVDAADRHDATMLVVGSNGEMPLKAIVLGSTPYRLLHMATRPVLVVPVRA